MWIGMWVLPKSRIQKKGRAWWLLWGPDPLVGEELTPGLKGAGCSHSSLEILILALELSQATTLHPDGNQPQAVLGGVPLTDAVITHVGVPIVTGLPGLQDPIPTRASMVYSVVHRVERGHLAKETPQLPEMAQAGWVTGAGDRVSGSSRGPAGGSPWLPPGWERASFLVSQSSAVVSKAVLD